MENEKHDLVILYSGGADSRLMLEFALKLNRKPYCVLIDYSQLHNNELQFAENQLQKLDVKYQTIKINGLNLNSGLTGDGVKGRFGEHVSEWHVPGRNTMFAGIAFSIAENLNIDEIWIGANYSDVINNFVDCKQDFINQINELFKVNGSFPIKFRAPLLGLEKNTILKLLKNFGVDESELFSGYGEISSKSKNDEYYNSDPYYRLMHLFDELPNDKEIEFSYQSYITLPSVHIPENAKSYSIPPGVYRLEGHDPLKTGFGIIFPINKSVDLDELNNYKTSCIISDLNRTKLEKMLYM